MNRRDFLKGINLVLLSAVIAPKIFANSLATNNQATSDASLELVFPLEPTARIIVIGLGQFGATAVKPLFNKLRDVECHIGLFDPTGCDVEKMSDLFATVRKSDLLFLVSGFDDPHCHLLFNQLADTAKRGGAVTVGVVPENDAIASCSTDNLLNHSSCFDTIFTVSDKSLNLQPEALIRNKAQQATLIDHAIRHAIATISNIITTTSMIGVDFADVKSILKSGTVGRIGVGVVKDHGWGRNAAMLALERLNDQQVSTDVAGILVSIHGSSLMAMDDYEAVSQVIHTYCPYDCNIIIGLLTDEQMGSNLKVTVLAVENDVNN